MQSDKILKKILIVTPLYPPDIGGPATHTIFVEEKLPPLGYRVTKCYFGDYIKYPYIIRHIIFFFAVLRLAWNTDAVYALDPLGVGLPAGLAAKLLGKRFVVRITGDRAWETGVQKFGVAEPLEFFATQKFYSVPIFFLKFGQYICAILANTVLVQCEYMRRVVTSWGVRENKIVVVPTLYSAPIMGERRPHQGYSIVTAGRLVPWKGVRALIELMPEILGLRGDITLTIAGDGPERAKLGELTSLLRLDDAVVFTGKLATDDLNEVLRGADLFVLNTNYESLSNQLFQVMHFGVPIVTTNVGGNPELIENGKEGILVEYNNHTELLAAIRTVIEQPILARSLAEHARVKLEQFNPDKIANQLARTL